MNQRPKLRKKSLKKTYILFGLIIFSIVLICTIALHLYMKSVQTEMHDERSTMERNFSKIDELEESLQEIVLRGRGYVAFKSETELSMLENGLDTLSSQITEFQSGSLNKKEKDLIRDIEGFYKRYRYNSFPSIQKLVKAGKYEELQRDFQQDGMNFANPLLNDVKDYKNTYQEQMRTLSQSLLERSIDYALFLNVSYGIMILLLFGISSVLISRILRPIEELEIVTHSIANGDSTKLPERKFNDEIGRLIGSFKKMTYILQAKEEDLMAHNQELMAQQSELEDQQNQLSYTLAEVETANKMLEELNELNHRLTHSLDKQEVVTSFHGFLKDTLPLDYSVLWMADQSVYASQNLMKDSVKRIMNTVNELSFERLQFENTYTISREIKPEQRGITDELFFAHDLYSAVLNSKNEIIAIYAATRIGKDFTKEEIDSLNGYMQRLGLSLGRIEIYEEVEFARQLNRDIVQNINEGIQFVDTEGTILEFNNVLQDDILSSDWKHDQIINYEDWIELFEKKTSSECKLRAFFEQALKPSVTEALTKQYQIGEGRFINMYATPVYRNENRMGTIFVHRDITKEHEVDQMKSELVSTVSHELRTPLSSILGFTELLLMRELKEERRKKYLQTIHKEANRLTNLINDFLDVQRMESGRQSYSMKNTRVDKIAMESIDHFKHKKDYNFNLIDEARYVVVRGDEDRLQQVFTNLLGNAVKFSPDGGNIEVKLKNVSSNLLVTIKDSGLGISSEDIQTLFKKFRRVDNSERRKIGGTGLGLSISKEIIEYHQGEVWIESKEGVGTTVNFTLPLIENIDEPNKLNNLTEPDIEENVMIVEDDASMALLLSEELKGKGFTVFQYTLPEKAFLEATHLGLVGIVVDLMLSEEISGWELIRMLKEDVRTKNIPIVISSALDKEKERMKLYKVDEYLTKPYHPAELTKVLNSFLASPPLKGDVFFPKEIK